MAYIDLEITKAAQASFLRNQKVSVGVAAIRIIVEAVRRGAPTIGVPATSALETFERDPRSLAFPDADAERLTAAALNAGYQSPGKYASQLLHALHLKSEPEGIWGAIIWLSSPQGNHETLTPEWRARMTPKGRMLAVGNDEFLFRSGIKPRVSLFLTRLDITVGAETALRELRKKVAGFAGHYLSDPDPLIGVRKVGPGPTALSARFEFEAVHIPNHGSPVTSKHKYLFALSQVREMDGGQYLPAWVINRKLREQHYAYEGRIEAINVMRTPADAIYAQIGPLVTKRIAAITTAHASWLADAPSREAEANARHESKEQDQVSRAEAQKIEQEAATARKERLSAKKAARNPDRELIGVHVIWPEWTGPSSSRKRIDHDNAPCTVRFYGSKREITLPDGSVITKKQGSHLKLFDTNGELV